MKKERLFISAEVASPTPEYRKLTTEHRKKIMEGVRACLVESGLQVTGDVVVETNYLARSLQGKVGDDDLRMSFAESMPPD